MVEERSGTIPTLQFVASGFCTVLHHHGHYNKASHTSTFKLERLKSMLEIHSPLLVHVVTYIHFQIYSKIYMSSKLQKNILKLK